MRNVTLERIISSQASCMTSTDSGGCYIHYLDFLYYDYFAIDLNYIRLQIPESIFVLHKIMSMYLAFEHGESREFWGYAS